MSNLGLYQVISATAKKVGGPENLIALTLSAGAAMGYPIIRTGEAVVKKVIKVIKNKSKIKNSSAVMYNVHTKGISNEGLQFDVGDKFRVLENDGDVVLIEKIGDSNNPYFVSAKLLFSISNLRTSDLTKFKRKK